MKAVVAAFNQEKALVGAFSVITNLRMQLFEALRQAEVRWCPRNERLVRELRRLELEFSSDPDQAAFRAFIQGTSPRYTPPNSLQLEGSYKYSSSVRALFLPECTARWSGRRPGL